MKWIDVPPVWLFAALVATWWIGSWQPFGLSLDHPVMQLVGGLMVGGGLVLIMLAALQMRRHRTTIIPHMEADTLVVTGVFARSRNPIYLGDTLILTGLALRWDAPIALILVPVFIWIIERRFIIPEEDRLRRKFRADFARYCQKTRRWI